MRATRDRLLETALEDFAGEGLIGASIERVCRRSGVSVGSAYHHFAGKEGLAGAVYVEALADFQREFTAALRAHADAEAGVRAGVATVLHWCLRTAPARAAFLLSASDAARGAAEPELEELNRQFFTEVLAWWRPHVRYGALRDLDPDLAHSVWLGPSLEYCRLRLGGRTRTPRSRAQTVLADAAWNALRSEGAPE